MTTHHSFFGFSLDALHITRTNILLCASLFGVVQLGCRTSIQTEIKEIEEEVIVEPVELTVHFGLENTAIIAGETVNYTIEILDQHDNILSDATWQIYSDIESDMFFTQEYMRPLRSGEHTVYVAVEYFDSGIGETIEKTVNTMLSVETGGVDFIDLVLQKGLAKAGENVGFDIIATDRYGNVVENVDTELISLDPNLVVNRDQLYSLVADFYQVTASYGEITDTEYIDIIPDDAYDIEIVVPNIEVERYDSLNCDVIVTDQFGNITEDPWTMWVEGSGTTTLFRDIVTFYDEGSYMLYAEVDDTTIMDSYGPILVDSTGPIITIYTPERGAWSEDASIPVEGNVIEEYSQLQQVWVDDSNVVVDANGDFATTVSLIDGVNVLETEAIDTDGNLSNDARAVLAGEFQEKDTGIDDAILVYLGSSGINTLETYAQSMVGSINLASVLPSNPVTTQSLGWCTARVNLYNPSYSSTSVDINPQSNGTIVLTFSMNGLYVNVDVPVSGFACPDFSGHVSASSVVASVTVNPYVSNHQLHMNVISSSSSVNGLNISISGIAGWILNPIISLFEGTISDLLEDEVQSALEDEVPPLLEDVFQSLELSQEFDLMGTTYTLDAMPSSVDVDDYGIGIGMMTNISSDNWVLPDEGLGSLLHSYPNPYFSGYSNVNIALSTDIVNQLLYQTWGGGLLSQEIALSGLGLGAEEIDLLFPNAPDLRVTIEALLPPVLVQSGAQLELQLGELYIAIHNGDYALGDIRLEVYAHIFAPMTLQVSNNYLTPSIGTPTTYFDVVYPVSGSRATESLFSALIPILLPTLTDAIGEIPIPSFQGLSINNITSTIVNGHIKITGTISL